MKADKIYVWIGFLGVALVGAGTVWAHVLPPPSPSNSPETVVAYYKAHLTGIRYGGILLMLGGAMLAPWFAAFSKQLRRIEGPGSIAASTQMTLGGLLILEIIIPIMFYEIAALRPDRSPELVTLLNDVMWIFVVGLAYTFIVECVVSAIAICLAPESSREIFPRWFGITLLAIAAASLPGAFDVLATTGPFAWNGLLAFWLPTAAFGVWMVTQTYVLLKAIAQDEVRVEDGIRVEAGAVLTG